VADRGAPGSEGQCARGNVFATQPFVTKPAAYDRQGVSESDLIDWTPEIKAEALRIAGLHKIGPIFTPPIVEGEAASRHTHAAVGHWRRNWKAAARP